MRRRQVLWRRPAAADRTASTPTTDLGLEPTPKPVRISLTGLSPGNAPAVAHLEGSTFVDAAGAEHPADAEPGKIVTDATTLDDAITMSAATTERLLTRESNVRHETMSPGGPSAMKEFLQAQVEARQLRAISPEG